MNHGLKLEGTEKNDEKLLEWAQSWVFENDTHLKYKKAKASYTIWGDNRGDILARDEMFVKRD
nr:hypothetical protein [uncultured Caldimonas sp.]